MTVVIIKLLQIVIDLLFKCIVFSPSIDDFRLGIIINYGIEVKYFMAANPSLFIQKFLVFENPGVLETK